MDDLLGELDGRFDSDMTGSLLAAQGPSPMANIPLDKPQYAPQIHQRKVSPAGPTGLTAAAPNASAPMAAGFTNLKQRAPSRDPLLTLKVQIMLRINFEIINQLRTKPFGTRNYAEGLKRLQTNLGFLHSLAEGKPLPAGLPALMTPPPDMPMLGELYRQLQAVDMRQAQAQAPEVKPPAAPVGAGAPGPVANAAAADMFNIDYLSPNSPWAR